MPVQTINKSFIKSLNYALALGDSIEAYHVSTNDEITKKLIERFKNLQVNATLVVENAPYRNISEKMIKYIDIQHEKLGKNDVITIVMPQFIIHKWWHHMLHNQTSLFLRTALLKRRNVSVVTIPYIINE